MKKYLLLVLCILVTGVSYSVGIFKKRSKYFHKLYPQLFLIKGVLANGKVSLILIPPFVEKLIPHNKSANHISITYKCSHCCRILILIFYFEI